MVIKITFFLLSWEEKKCSKYDIGHKIFCKVSRECLIFLKEKIDGSMKSRTCENRRTQRSHDSKGEASSPLATVESMLLTTTIEAKEERDVGNLAHF